MTEDYGSNDFAEKEDDVTGEATAPASFVDVVEALIDDMPADDLVIEYALALAERVRVPVSGSVKVGGSFDPLDAIRIRLGDDSTKRCAVIYFKARHPRVLFSFGDEGQAVMLLGAVTDEVEILEKILSWVTGLTDKTPA